MDFVEFFKNYNINLTDVSLMQRAFTHTSYANEHNVLSYERLEFLGDAVLELVTSEYFYLNSTLAEGAMSKKRASFVCEEALATYSKKIGLNKYIRVGNGELNNINDTIIADVFEAVLAVIYLECGFNKAKDTSIILVQGKEDKTVSPDYSSIYAHHKEIKNKSRLTIYGDGLINRDHNNVFYDEESCRNAGAVKKSSG